MIRLLAFLFAAFPLAATAAAGGIEQEIREVERACAAAIVRNDAAEIGPFFLDDWVIVDSDAHRVDKTRFLEVIRRGVLTHERMDWQEMSVRVYGDTAVVTGWTLTRGSYEGTAFTEHERVVDVLVRRDGRWRYAYTQLTRIPPGETP